ncbi:MAG TPA: acylphosphatase [Allosphingosinicella sp.]|nr:acylphosphatase [Allosphingosinicella sp.]
MRVTRRVRIHGRVQGVFYRGWSVDNARALRLDGWVRNRRDGSVEMLLAGSEEAVEAMIARCREGPPAARVERIEVAESDDAAPAGFEARPTL